MWPRFDAADHVAASGSLGPDGVITSSLPTVVRSPVADARAIADVGLSASRTCADPVAQPQFRAQGQLSGRS
jgi:hypothetical protein